MGQLDYYASLARRLSAGEMAKAAVRRAYRTARTKLYRPQDPSRRHDILKAFFAREPEDLVERALGPRPISAWCDLRRRPSVRAALERVPGARDRALARATAFAENRFVVFGRPVHFGEDPAAIDWARDVSSGHRYPSLAAEAVPLFVNGSDPKYPWALGRLDSLVGLGQGYWACGSSAEADRFAQAFAGQLRSFLAQNPPAQGVHWTCTMEVALRGANLAQALLLFADSAPLQDGAFLLDALEALAAHAGFVEANLEDASAVPNNHLVADLVGLLVMALCFPELPGAARWIGLAVQGLREEMPAQVHPDGWSFEGSIPYHRLACELFALAHAFAEEAGVSLGVAYEARLRGMFRVARDYCSEGGLAPQLGDNDSGRAFAVTDRASLDHAYLAPLGAALLDAAELKAPGSVLPDEGAWLLGQEGVERFARLEPRARARSRISAHAGLHVLRGEGLLLALSAGPHGQKGVGGHNHNDKLSFELHVDGAPVIVDPGSPVYGGHPEERNRFRGTARHNTPELDGREQSAIDPSRLFALEDGARARVLRAELQGPTLPRAEEREPAAEGLEPTGSEPRGAEVAGEHAANGVTDAAVSAALAAVEAVVEAGPPTEAAEEPLPTEGLAQQRVDRVVAAHDGYAPVRVTRVLELWADERAVVGRDELGGGTLHEVAIRFHLPDAEARLRPSSGAEQERAERLAGPGLRFPLAVELGRSGAVLVLEEGPQVGLEESEYSPGYGERREARCVVARVRRELPLAFRWVVLAGAGGGNGEGEGEKARSPGRGEEG